MSLGAPLLDVRTDFPVPLLQLDAGSSGRLLLTGATVVDGTGSNPSPSSSILVEGDRIAGIGPDGSFSTADHDRVLPVAGRFVMPGLIDAHVHLMGSAAGRDPFRRYLEPYTDTRVLRAAATAQGFLARGVTTLRHLGHGDPRHVSEVRQAIGGGIIPGPRILTSEWAISQSGGHGGQAGWPQDLVDRLQPNAAFCDGPDALRQLVRQNVEAGADCIKIFVTEGVISTVGPEASVPNFTVEEVGAVVEEAHRLGVRVAAHTTGRAGAERAIEAGVDTLEHGPEVFDGALLDRMVAKRIVVVPTLSVFGWVKAEGHLHGIPDEAIRNAADSLHARVEYTRGAFSNGCEIAVGSDSGTKPRLFGTADEIAALSAAGFSPGDVIRAATLGGARALGIDGEVGTLQAGKRADMLVLDADPVLKPSILGTSQHIELVLKAGRSERGLPEPTGRPDE